MAVHEPPATRTLKDSHRTSISQNAEQTCCLLQPQVTRGCCEGKASSTAGCGPPKQWKSGSPSSTTTKQLRLPKPLHPTLVFQHNATHKQTMRLHHLLALAGLASATFTCLPHANQVCPYYKLNPPYVRIKQDVILDTISTCPCIMIIPSLSNQKHDHHKRHYSNQSIPEHVSVTLLQVSREVIDSKSRRTTSKGLSADLVHYTSKSQ